MNHHDILILTAVEIEKRAIRNALSAFGGQIQCVGIGARYLPDRSDLQNISTILMCGLAGGLDPSLQIADVVVDARQRSPFLVTPGEASTLRPIDCRTGTIHTAKTIVPTPQQKAELFHQTGAIAVDMEQAIIRQWAEAFGIPVIGIRAISDTAAHVLDPAVVGMVDDLGNPRPMHIARQLLQRPGLIPYLRTLGKNTNIALAALAAAVRAVVDQLEGN